ncbi:MAG: hypothetical protein JWQ81_5099 [Amycolatopsis sp.]|uniref:DUF6923 family protein n=1 Tax=Amycolatopsis sp. TaxID=37632 RepID=UPI00261BBC25|nr:hypothetical protein [Amycolatopsis sp.]MCU1684360.1 hypothetical protein [Amycolatopsis sp.]
MKLGARKARWYIACLVALLAGMTVLFGLLPSSPPASGANGGVCQVLEVANVRPGASSSLTLRELPGTTVTQLGNVGYWLNALGYSSAQHLGYAVADGNAQGRFHDGAHAVTVAEDGTVADLGPIRRQGARRVPWSLVTGATAGAISGNSWYIRKDSDLYTVDVDPASPDYLSVVSRVPLRLTSLAVGVDDFDFDPADGLLYGVSTSWRGNGSVVTIDPTTGWVQVVPGPRVPRGGAVGSVTIGGDGALYVTANEDGHHSVSYRVPRDGSGPVTKLGTGPALVSSDSAGCFSPAPPPPSPTTSTPPPTTSSSPTPTPTPTPRSVPVPTPTPTPTPTPPPPPAPLPIESPPPAPTTPVVTPTVTPSPTPPPPAPTSKRPPTPQFVAAVKKDQQTAVKRRWSLTVLILVLGSGAAMHSLRRHR